MICHLADDRLASAVTVGYDFTSVAVEAEAAGGSDVTFSVDCLSQQVGSGHPIGIES